MGAMEMAMVMAMTMTVIIVMTWVMTITWIVQEQIATVAIKNKKIITEDKVEIHIPSSAVKNMDRFNLTRIRNYFDTDAWTALEANLMSKKRTFTLCCAICKRIIENSLNKCTSCLNSYHVNCMNFQIAKTVSYCLKCWA